LAYLLHCNEELFAAPLITVEGNYTRTNKY